jgi:hypothetical protein
MVGSVLKSLHERGLIDVTGRGEGLGRPLLYGTTPVFLEYFGLRHLEELPRGDELAIALRAPDRPDAPAVDRIDRADRAVEVPSVRADVTVEESRPESVETTADAPGLAEAGV